MNLKLHCKGRKRNGKYPIYLIIRVRDKETKVPTGIDIQKERWDDKKKEPIYNGVFCHDIRFDLQFTCTKVVTLSMRAKFLPKKYFSRIKIVHLLDISINLRKS